MTTGRVNIGGGGGVKKLYRLFRQTEQPIDPKQGDMWVIPIKETSQITISLDVPETPFDGELLLQFIDAVYAFNFQEISSKIGGNLDTTEYVYNVTSLIESTINNNYIPLFQKDVVKEYAILKRISQYDSSSGKWETPESYYYNGTRWVSMVYKIFTQFNTGAIQKRLPETNVISETVSGVPLKAFRIMPNGDYYTKVMSGNNIIVSKYSSIGELISSMTLTSDNGEYPANIMYIDDLGYIYATYSTSALTSLAFGVVSVKYLKKIAPDGSVIWTVDFATRYIQSLSLGVYNGKIIFTTAVDGSSGAHTHILDMNSGVYVKGMTYYGYGRYHSNAIFEEDGFWMVEDGSTSAGANIYVVKRSYDGAVLKVATNQSSGQASVYIQNMSYADNIFHLYKHPTEQDKFIVVYSRSDASSINELICDFNTGYLLPSGFKVSIAVPTGYNPTNNALRSCMDNDNNIYVIWYNKYRKYNIDGLLTIDETIVNMSFASNFYHWFDGLFEYYRG